MMEGGKLTYIDHQSQYGCYGFRFLDEFSEPGVQIETIGVEHRNSTDYYFNGRTRKEQERFLFQYTLSGWGMFIDNGISYKIEEGQAFLTKIPSEHTYFFPEASEKWEFLFIMLYGCDVEKHWNEIIECLGPTPRFKADSTVIRLLLSIYREAASKKIRDGYQLSGLAYQTLMELRRSQKKYDYEEYTDMIRTAINMMLNDFDKPYGIDTIACRLGISQYHFIRQFTKMTGISPGKYLSKIRIQKAVELLQNTDLPLNEIAEKIGYSNANYFIKVFRSYLGMPPGAFRLARRNIPYTHLTL